MVNKLNKLAQEANGISKELKDVDDQYNDLKKKRAEVKALIDDLKRNPEKATPPAIEQVIATIDELKGKAAT